jgi:hypothetical protein
MTPAPQPHPLRCETCKIPKNKTEPKWCPVIEEWVGAMYPEKTFIFSKSGCASHSASSDVLEERKRILDEIRVWLHQHCYWFYVNGHEGEQRYHFEVVKFREFLEEFRLQTKERERG